MLKNNPLVQGLLFGLWVSISLVTAYAAIAWPTAPAGEVNGGKYSGFLVPSGAVMSFNLATCPSGWKVADGSNSTPDLRGEFIRGVDLGRGLDTGRTLGSTQIDELKSHQHNLMSYFAANASFVAGVSSGVFYGGGSGGNTTTTGGSETRPHNVALLYCQKN